MNAIDLNTRSSAHNYAPHRARVQALDLLNMMHTENGALDEQHGF
jgi:hypothetical protein